MKNRAAFSVSVLLLLFGISSLILFPAVSAKSAVDGLKICGEAIIPSLFPFFVLSGLASSLGVPELLGKYAEAPMQRLFGVSGECCAPFLLGLTGGYPVGAASVAELVRRGRISDKDAAVLLPFCNNTGPAFIIGAAGAGVFSSGKIGLLLYVSHFLAAMAVGAIFSRFLKAPARPTAPPPAQAQHRKSLALALPGCIKAAAASTVNICAFVVFFSVVKGILERLDVFQSLSYILSQRLDSELSFSRALLTGILELGGGIAAMRGLAPVPVNLALASFILGFGSLSVHCQTLSVIDGTNIKCARHFTGRILHGLLSALLTFVLSVVLRV